MCGRKNWIRSLKYWILIVNLLLCSTMNMRKIIEPLSLPFHHKNAAVKFKKTDKNAAVKSYLFGRLSEAVNIGRSEAVAEDVS